MSEQESARDIQLGGRHKMVMEQQPVSSLRSPSSPKNEGLTFDSGGLSSGATQNGPNGAICYGPQAAHTIGRRRHGLTLSRILLPHGPGQRRWLLERGCRRPVSLVSRTGKSSSSCALHHHHHHVCDDIGETFDELLEGYYGFGSSQKVVSYY